MKQKVFSLATHKKIVLAVILLSVVNAFFVSVFLVRAFDREKPTVITLTEDGFSPPTITIPQNGKVIFKTELSEDFWPASNLHPDHTLYPEFDPKSPISPDKTWSFIFSQSGTWTFHDHLRPQNRGTIIVKSTPQTITTDHCSNIQGAEQLKCWEQAVTSSLEDGNVEGAFLWVTSLYEKDPVFAAGCHDFTHRIGEKAAELFQKGTTIPLSDKASYCAYGFYHGFMTKLLTDNAQYKKIADFCNTVTASQTSALSDACYHGVGHGALTDASEKKANDSNNWITDAIATCERVAKTSLTRSRCASGIFMEAAILMGDNKLPFISSQPLAICTKQQTYQLDCYTQMYGAISLASLGDTRKGMSFIEEIPNDSHAQEATITYIGTVTSIASSEVDNMVTLCRQVQDRLHLPCIKGISLSYMLKGTPQKEYVLALDLCHNTTMTQTEQEACMNQVLAHSKTTYSPSVLSHICSTVDEKYQSQCKTH